MSKRKAPHNAIGGQTAATPSKKTTADKFTGRRHSSNADLVDAFRTMGLTDEQDEFRKTVKQLATRTPRFLFRFWSDQSGGNKALNTIEAVTPHAFHREDHNEESLHQLWKADRSSLHQLGQGHLRGAHVNSVYSSWSQSLALVLTWAAATASRNDTVHICVVDTTKISNTTIILHTEAWGEALSAGRGKWNYAHEFLAYGVIRGACYRAVPMRHLIPNLDANIKATFASCVGEVNPLMDIFVGANKRTTDRMDAIIRIAAQYGRELEIPFAVHMLCLAVTQPAQLQIAMEALCQKCTIPEEFSKDSSIMQSEAQHYGYRESEQAAILLRQLVVMKYGEPMTVDTDIDVESSVQTNAVRKTTSAVKSAPKKIKKFKGQKKRAEKAMASITESTRLPEAVKSLYPRMVKELYIDLKGWAEYGSLTILHVDEAD